HSRDSQALHSGETVRELLTHSDNDPLQVLFPLRTSRYAVAYGGGYPYDPTLFSGSATPPWRAAPRYKRACLAGWERADQSSERGGGRARSATPPGGSHGARGCGLSSPYPAARRAARSPNRGHRRSRRGPRRHGARHAASVAYNSGRGARSVSADWRVPAGW